MDKIDNFEKFEAALEEADYEFDEIDSNLLDMDALKNIILTNTELLKNAHKVLIDYYGMKVPNDMLQQVLVNDLELAYECYTDGIRDTCQRSVLVDAILKHIGMNSWPTYGEGEEYSKNFKDLLSAKAK